jgi:polyphenol oxidase
MQAPPGVDWLLPQWPAPPRVRAVCTTRAGGMSVSPWDSLNLGTHVGDDPANVLRNRAVLQCALGVRPVFMEQVHGTRIQPLASGNVDGCVADAAVTQAPGLACTTACRCCCAIPRDNK